MYSSLPSPFPPHSIPQWAAQGDLLTELAVHDLQSGGEVRPTMVAFLDDQALFLVTLRPFSAGGHHRPVIEVAAVAVGLGANRVMLSLAGRAWSTDDPIPPVTADGDLRQRVITIHSVDGAITPPRSRNRIVPYDICNPATSGDHVQTGPPLCDAAAEGFVPATLAVTVAEPDAAPAPGTAAADELCAQLRRCEQLGHRFAWGADVVPYIDQLGATAPDPRLDW